MQHEDYKDAVNAKFTELHWDAPRKEHLQLRCKVASEMFEAEPEDVKQQIRNEALEEQKAELRKWQDADDGLPSLEPDDQKE